MEVKKYLCHVPTESYGFISVEVEGTAQEAVDAYKEVQDFFKNDSILPVKEWNAWLDSYIKGKAGKVEDWEKMSFEQKQIINEIKKSHKRTNK